MKADTVEQQVTVQADVINKLDLTIPRTGIFITLTTPDGQPVKLGVRKVLYSLVPVMAGEPYQLPDGRLWINQLPEVTRDLSLRIFRGAGGQVLTTLETKVELQEKQVALTVVVPPLLRPRVRVLDAAGQPVRNADLPVATLTFPDNVKIWQLARDSSRKQTVLIQPLVGDGYDMDQRHFISNTRDSRVEIVRTDGDGILCPGEFPAGATFTLWLESRDAPGKPVTMTVDAAGAVTPAEYRLGPGRRTITQTVFDALGRPAPQRRVFLSYGWHDRLYQLQDVSDAQGRVTWVGVPAVPAVVWGEGVPAGELPADAVAVTTPLPAYRPHTGWLRIFLPVSLPLTKQHLRFAVRNYMLEFDNYADCYRVYRAGPDPEVDPPGVNLARFWFNGGFGEKTSFYVTEMGAPPLYLDGGPVSAMIWFGRKPNRCTAVADFHAPPGGGGVFAPPLAPEITVRLRFTLPDGTPVARAPRVRVVPAGEGALAKLFADPGAVADGVLTPEPAADGTLMVHPPLPGEYRLEVPGCPDTTALHFVVKEGEQTVALTLPVPQSLVPPGVTVFCLPQATPTCPETVVAPAGGGAMPFYVDTRALLAYWYRPTPDRLVLWQATNPTKPQTLSLRSLAMTLDDGAYGGTFTLLPLLPTPGNAPVMSKEEHTNAEAVATRLRASTRTHLHLWPGSYVLVREGGFYKGVPSAVITIPEDGPDELTVKLPDPNGPDRYVLRGTPPSQPRGENQEHHEGAPVSLLLPYTPGMNWPGEITLTDNHNRTVSVNAPYWVLNPMLKTVSATLYGIEPGAYKAKIAIEAGAVEAPVTVTDAGGYVRVER